MSRLKKSRKIFLTGADCFILALEKQPFIEGTSGNICRYVIELEGNLDTNGLISKIKNNENIQWLASLSVYKSHMFARPVWKINEKGIVDINVHESDSFIPEEVLNKRISVEKPGLFFFDVIHRSKGNSCFIFSWSHLIMDGFGAVLLLKHLNDSKLGVFLTDDPIEAGAASFNEAVKAKQFIEATKKNILTGLSPSFRHKQINQKIKVITFSKEETDEIRANGPKLGALFGPGPLYLASAARAVREILAGRQTIVNNFWVPVPQNQRKKGATGPLLGNHLSFLFYLLSNADLTSTDRSVRSINSQMVNQVKLGIPKSYASLMQYLRRIPYALYHHYTRGKKGASLSSFLFTVAEEHPKELMTFHGLKVVEALSFPPNIYPPGLTFAFMAFGGYLHILLQYYDEVISEVEITKLEAIMRQELVLPDCS